MWSVLTERRALSRWSAPSHALWLGPGGLWDHGPLPGWRRWAAPAATATATATTTAPRQHADFDRWCRAMPGRGCQLMLSAWLLHELLLDPALPLANDSARLVYARGLLQHYHGDVAAQWPLAAWQAGGQRGVSALHALTLTALQASARQAGVALRGVRPWWSLALALAQQRLPALATADSARLLVVDGLLVTQIDLARGRLRQLQQRRLAEPSPAALLALHGGLQPAGCSAAIGHGLQRPWPAAAAGTELKALGSLHGEAPAALWQAATRDSSAGTPA